jgi:Zn-dependent M28 family amino/carboxypeptidase
MRSRSTLFRHGLLALLLPLAACRPDTETPGAEATPTPAAESALLAAGPEAEKAITAEVLREPIAVLASDEYEGRGPGSPGDAKARQYLVAQMQQIGLQPGAEGGGWEQPFAMVAIASEAPPTWTFTGGSGSAALARRDDFVAFPGGQEPQSAIADAEVVFVGYGIQAPEYQWDDFKGQDMKGKVLLMLNNDPDWDPQLFAGNRRLYYGRWTYKYESAARQGAAGAIIIHTTPSAGYPYQVVQTSWGGEQFELPTEGEPRVQVRSWVTEDAAKRIAQLGGKTLEELVDAARSREFQPVPLGVRTSIRLRAKLREIQTANVLGRLEGSDPELADEVVLFVAHHDHLGVGDPDADGDRIYNGALDNASGCSQALAIARAFEALPQPPRRSLLFAFVAAEEQGLLGSKYLAEHPPVPPGKMAGLINYDSANIWGRATDVTFIGMEKSSLGAVVERFAAEQGRTVEPDQFPDKGFYYRSDQFSLAKVGVPGIYLDNGTRFRDRPEGWGKEQIEKWEQEHYHQPSDELTSEWSFEGMVEDARLGFRCGLYIAESDEMPAWTPGDEFEAARREAIRAAETGGAAAPASSGR